MKSGLMLFLATVSALLSAEAATAADKPKICFVYPGSRTDGGWSEAQEKGRLAVDKALGDRVETSFVEKVAEDDLSEAVFERLASSGCNMIFATAFGYMEPVLKVAARHPDVRFEHATGFKTTRNVAAYNARFYQGRYLTGRIAARVSKTGKAVYIAPFAIPEVLQGINAFEIGAQSVNPAFKTKVVFMQSWFVPDKEAKAVKDAIGEGADIVSQQTDSTAPLQVAETNNVKAFGHGADRIGIAPLAQLTSIVYNWGAYDVARVNAYLDGSWASGLTWDGLKPGLFVMAPYKNMSPEDVAFAQDGEKKLVSGVLKPFKGPVRYQDGKTWLKKNELAMDSVIQSMDFLVNGVEGKLP